MAWICDAEEGSRTGAAKRVMAMRKTNRSRHRLIPPDMLLGAYAVGCFPMGDPDTGALEWYTADPRPILPLDPFHVPRRLRRDLRHSGFTYTQDSDFEQVMRACGDRSNSWITESIVGSYVQLHELGFAHSVEVWRESDLVGGLYGVHLGGAFFGESVFNRAPNAGKAALVHLAEHLVAREIGLLEVQMVTNLTAQFAPRLMSRDDYERLLDHQIRRPCRWDAHVSPVPITIPYRSGSLQLG